MAAPSAYIKSVEYLQLEEILADSATAYTTDTAIDLSERLDSLNFDPSIVEFKVEADSKVQAIFTAMSEAKITVVITGLTEAEEAGILGRTTVGNMYGIGDCTAMPSYMVKFQALMTDGSYKWFEFWKVTFKERKREFKTQKSGSLEVLYVTLEGLATARIYQHSSDTGVGNLGFVSEDTTIGATWFSLGDNLSTPDTVAPSISSVTPADTTADVAITANVVWVFDKGLLSSTVNTSNFMLFKETDGTAIAAAVTLGTDAVANDEVTLNPTSSLSNSTEYKAIVSSNVKSANGVNLAANSMTYFTTVAP